MSDIPWSCVQHTAERVAIIASGPSLKGVDLTTPDGIAVIAVNRALLHVPRADFWFTLDYSEANRGIAATAVSRPSTVFYACAPASLGQPTALPRYLREPPEPGIHYLRRIVGENAHLGQMPGLSRDPTGIHVGNSAYGAMGLAYLMILNAIATGRRGAKQIALLGVDGKGGYAWGNGAPRDLQHLHSLFDTAVHQLAGDGIEVVVGSLSSRVHCWPRMRPEAALEWIGGR